MESFWSSLSGRETALLMYLFAFIVFVCAKSKLRKSALRVVKAFFHWKIQASVFILVVYVVLCTLFLNYIGLWNVENIKTTIVWVLTFALVTMFNVNRNIKDIYDYKKEIGTFLGATAFVEFLMNLYSFNLTVELVLFLVIFIISIFSAISKTDSKLRTIEIICDTMLVVIAMAMVVYSIAWLYSEFNSIDMFGIARELALPLVFSLLYLPFMAGLFVFTTYERVFLRMEYSNINKDLLSYSRRRAVMNYGANIKALEKWARYVALARVTSKKDIKDSMDKIQSLIVKERDSPSIPFACGWSPYRAMHFLERFGLDIKGYNILDDEEWIGSASREIGNDLLRDNLLYCIEGDEDVVYNLKLMLNVYNTSSSESSLSTFFSIANSLIENSNVDTIFSIDDKFDEKYPEGVVVGKRHIKLSKNIWIGGVKGGYSRKLVISLDK